MYDRVIVCSTPCPRRESHGVVDGVVSLIQTVITMVFFLVLCIFITRYVICHFMRAVFTFSSELFQLVLIAFCLLIAWLSDHIGLSIELGAFIAGVMVSSTTFQNKPSQKIEPIRNLFAALFLTAIGMIMNPYFLLGSFGCTFRNFTDNNSFQMFINYTSGTGFWLQLQNKLHSWDVACTSG